jgi:hypothetical protein
MPNKTDKKCEHLLTLIGRQVSYHQQQCEIIEVLDGCQLVLQVLDKGSNIQSTQYGEGHRTVPQTHTLNVFDADGALHPDIIAAGLDEALGQMLADFR